MDNLKERVRDVVFSYAGGGFNVKTFPMENQEQTDFAVLIADTYPRKRDADILVFVRIEGEFVIIEADSTDTLIVERLQAKGVPREKIICANAGEMHPERQSAP